MIIDRGNGTLFFKFFGNLIEVFSVSWSFFETNKDTNERKIPRCFLSKDWHCFISLKKMWSQLPLLSRSCWSERNPFESNISIIRVCTLHPTCPPRQVDACVSPPQNISAWHLSSMILVALLESIPFLSTFRNLTFIWFHTDRDLPITFFTRLACSGWWCGCRWIGIIITIYIWNGLILDFNLWQSLLVLYVAIDT